MIILTYCIALLDTLLGLFLLGGSWQVDQPGSPARSGALLMEVLLLGSAVLLVGFALFPPVGSRP